VVWIRLAPVKLSDRNFDVAVDAVHYVSCAILELAFYAELIRNLHVVNAYLRILRQGHADAPAKCVNEGVQELFASNVPAVKAMPDAFGRNKADDAYVQSACP
jgi:hypothetical protein